MNLNRLKSNLVNRDWSSKNTKTNISYIKGKLNQFGLSTPKYLDNGKLTNKQIQAQTKRIVNAINREKDILRKEANKKTFDNYMNKLQKTVEKHNKLVYKKLGYLVNKYNMSENQLNYMIGRDVNVNGYKHDNKYTFSRTNSQFQIIDLENFYVNDIEAIRNRIRQINKLNERLTNRNIDKEVKNSLEAKAKIKITKVAPKKSVRKGPKLIGADRFSIENISDVIVYLKATPYLLKFVRIYNVGS